MNPNFLYGNSNMPVIFGNVLFQINGQFTIGKYDTATGTVINSTFITLTYSGASALAVSGTTLYVANSSTGTISTFLRPRGLSGVPGARAWRDLGDATDRAR